MWSPGRPGEGTVGTLLGVWGFPRVLVVPREVLVTLRRGFGVTFGITEGFPWYLNLDKVLPVPRPKNADPRTHSITVKMSHADLELLDQRRKSTGRSAYLRWLLLSSRPQPVVDPVQPVTGTPPPIRPTENPFTDDPPDQKHWHRYEDREPGSPCTVCGKTRRENG